MQQNSYRFGSEFCVEIAKSYKNPRENLNWPVACRLALKMDNTNIKLYRSRGRKRQTCKVCRCPDKFDFSVPDEMWKRVVPLEYQQGMQGRYRDLSTSFLSRSPSGV